MKHFEVKKLIFGSKGAKAEPASLNPPNPDTTEDVIVNNTVFQGVDIISEGPIEGFVNEEGVAVTGDDIPQAIYLDEVPVMTPAGKYNFQRFAYDTRLGYSNQTAMRTFNRPSMEYTVQKNLYGEHKFPGGVTEIKFMGMVIQRKQEVQTSQGDAKRGYNSIDYRKQNKNKNFSYWWDSSAGYVEQTADSVTHIIKNKDTVYFSFTLGIQQLYDTCSIDGGGDGSLRSWGDRRLPTGKFNRDYKAGSNIPTICTIRVTWGRITMDGKDEIHKMKEYDIYGMTLSQANIDFGANNYSQNPYKTFAGAIRDRVGNSNMETFSFPEDWNTEETCYKYVKFTKVTPETYSSLIKRSIYIYKVAEHSPMFLSYPLCALGAVKGDGRIFSSVPKRAYLARLMKIFVPNNYQPLITEQELIGYEWDKEKNEAILDENGDPIPIYKDVTTDRRRYARAIDKSSVAEKLQVYVGDWDYVSLVKKWTDNPVWIVLDILTNSRYGMGAYVSMEDIDMVSFYDAAKYCDGVDEQGYFIGFSNGFGGLEPRYSFSATLTDRMTSLEVISSILSLIDGSLYWSNGKISLTYKESSSRVKALFNNRNVIDGVFIYSSNRRDQKFNLVEVTYNDETDLYKSKIEYRMDEGDLKENGVTKTSFNAWGCCSKGMAQRLGDRYLEQVNQDVQTVTFSAGYDALLLELNDLFFVDDDLMNLTENYARLTAVGEPDSQGLVPFTVDSVVDLSRSDTDESGVVTLYVYRIDPNYSFGDSGEKTPDIISELETTKWEVVDGETVFWVKKSTIGPDLTGFHLGSVVSIALKDNSTQIYRLASITDQGNGSYQVVGYLVSREKYEAMQSPSQAHYQTIALANDVPLISDSPMLYASAVSASGINYDKEYQDMADDKYDEMMGILPPPENLAVAESFDTELEGYLGKLTITWDEVEHASKYKILVKNSSNQEIFQAYVNSTSTRSCTFDAPTDKYYIYAWTINSDDMASRYPSTLTHYFVDASMTLKSPEITNIDVKGRQ